MKGNKGPNGCLGYIVDENPTQLCMDYNKSHCKDPYETTRIQWKVRLFVVFFVVQVCAFQKGISPYLQFREKLDFLTINPTRIFGKETWILRDWIQSLL